MSLKIVVWGHPLHSHSHSYIHEGFVKAFRYLRHETHWASGEKKQFDSPSHLFLTEGQVDAHIPMRPDCFYVLHNCDVPRYLSAGIPEDHILSLEATRILYQEDRLAKANWFCPHAFSIEREEHGCDILYQPWATDLLPHEIDPGKAIHPPLGNSIVFVGTYNDGGPVPEYGNKNRLDAFLAEAERDGHPANISGLWSSRPRPVGTKEAMSQTKACYMAPAIQCPAQTRTGYVPCRLLKNVSYGVLGVSNSPRMHTLFGNTIVFNEDCQKLYWDAKDALESTDVKQRMQAAMTYVRDNHTYVQRAITILERF